MSLASFDDCSTEKLAALDFLPRAFNSVCFLSKSFTQSASFLVKSFHFTETAMSSSSFPWARHNHGSMASVTAAQESSDASSRAVLFDIVCTLRRLESNIQAQHDRLSFFESSIRAESVTTGSPTMSKSSFDSQRSQRESILTTPPLSPAEDRNGSAFMVQSKFEYEDGAHGDELPAGM